ncbi:MAG: hypothetical protein U0002_08605 [Thermoanaerobaculia bacterium]
MTSSLRPLLVVLALASWALPAHAGEADKTAAFALDEWIELKATDGPVTLHRIRLARQGGFTKSKFMRPGNAEYLEDVQIQLEFSNESEKDWEAHIKFEWLDEAGKVIDGYNNNENLDGDSKFDKQTVTLSTLKYGLEKARKVKIHIEFERD